MFAGITAQARPGPNRALPEMHQPLHLGRIDHAFSGCADRIAVSTVLRTYESWSESGASWEALRLAAAARRSAGSILRQRIGQTLRRRANSRPATHRASRQTTSTSAGSLLADRATLRQAEPRGESFKADTSFANG